MSRKNAAVVGLVILAGLIVFVLGWVAADLFTVGVIILLIGAVGFAVLAGDYVIQRQRRLVHSRGGARQADDAGHSPLSTRRGPAG
ncbi:MAG: hypothetical protein LBV34_09695 [Nocardiopsaceae bacterium]|jgi:hypothetical protein|nr:hypothetical protein [Nocardiopsaceae bacterium]